MTSTCRTCSKSFSFHPSNSSGRYCSQPCSHASPEWREKQAAAKRGKRHTEHARAKMSRARRGVKKSPEHAEKLRAHLDRVRPNNGGPNSPVWKGGATVKQKGWRASVEYRRWRRAVLERDDRQCVSCGSRERLEVDHVEPSALLELEARVCSRPEWMFEVSNGRTLCKGCHARTATHHRRVDSYPEGRLMLVLGDDYPRIMEQLIERYKRELE